jgi:hypothetical protein
MGVILFGNGGGPHRPIDPIREWGVAIREWLYSCMDYNTYQQREALPPTLLISYLPFLSTVDYKLS